MSTATPKSSSTDPVEDGTTIKDTISLGKQIAEHLESTDTLGRWMAHYVAELIASADASPDNLETQRECAREILQLWAHRSTFPGPYAPLASFEPIVRALERLDPETIAWGYFDAYRPGAQPNSKPDATAVDLALTLDRSLGGVIRVLLREATVDAVSAERKWLGPREDETSVVSSIIEAMGYGASKSRETADAIRSIEHVRAVLEQIADYLRDRETG